VTSAVLDATGGFAQMGTIDLRIDFLHRGLGAWFEASARGSPAWADGSARCR
jgi:hypothetical protein